MRHKIHKQVHIALIVETVRKDGSKDGKGLNLMLMAQVQNTLEIYFYQLHMDANIILSGIITKLWMGKFKLHGGEDG